MHAFETWAADLRPAIDAHLRVGLTVFANHAVAAQSPLLDAMQHGVMNGGKRVRALAVLAAGELVDAPRETLLSVAAALEYIHAYSLIHDDLPCMDDDDLRRGQPTVHVVFGEAQALLAGDALQTLAFSTLAATDLSLDATAQVALIRELSDASGVIGMAGGQAIDLHHVGQVLSMDDMQTMHALKTGALLKASLMMGAMCGKPLTKAHQLALKHFADVVGLLFQVVDDVLDATQDTATLGKTAGKDLQADKPTYVREMGLAGARDYVAHLYSEALLALQPFGSNAQRLGNLAAYCAMRVY